MIYMYYCVSPLLTYALYLCQCAYMNLAILFMVFCAYRVIRLRPSVLETQFLFFCLFLPPSFTFIRRRKKGERTIFPPSHIPLILSPPNIRMYEMQGFRINHEGALDILLFPFCPLYSYTQTTNKFFFHSFHYFFLHSLSLLSASFTKYLPGTNCKDGEMLCVRM